MTLEIAQIDVLSDNYTWLLHEPLSGETAVVDPALAEPVMLEAARRKWRITQIWNTHWHPDHIGGNDLIKAHTGCKIYGPAAEKSRISSMDVALSEGDRVSIGAASAVIYEVPAHTAGHIAFHIVKEHLLFVGDTLFAMGCGKLFEGTAAQMFANMQRFAGLPDHTQVYCAHEYTQSNGRFALTVEPENLDVLARMKTVDHARSLGKSTIPTSIGLERRTNPFLRAKNVETLASLRAARDHFTG